MATQREPKPIFDRLPPQNIDAERSVLGSMLLNAEAVGTTVELLRENAEELFYTEAHQQIYAAMVALFRKSIPIDVLTLTEQLSKDQNLESAGGASYIAELSSAVPTSANVEYYAKIVLDAAVLRKLISTCARISGQAYNTPEDVNELLDEAEAHIFSIAEVRQLNPIHKVADLLEDSIHRIEEIIKSHAGYTGIPTGYKRFGRDALGVAAVGHDHPRGATICREDGFRPETWPHTSRFSPAVPSCSSASKCPRNSWSSGCSAWKGASTRSGFARDFSPAVSFPNCSAPQTC